jgi:hypothetical protein
VDFTSYNIHLHLTIADIHQIECKCRLSASPTPSALPGVSLDRLEIIAVNTGLNSSLSEIHWKSSNILGQKIWYRKSLLFAKNRFKMICQSSPDSHSFCPQISPHSFAWLPPLYLQRTWKWHMVRFPKPPKTTPSPKKKEINNIYTV